MPTGHVFIATSLDGFIARADGDIEWLHEIDAAGEDHGYDAMMASVDGLVMGRNTFQKVLTFGEWPYGKPVIVLSKLLSEASIPAELKGRVEISDASPKALMEELGDRGWHRVYVDGGRVIQSFLRDDLIETLQITRIPRLIGQGAPLFASLQKDVLLQHIETTSFPSGLVSSTYRVTR